jgi:hypothetical protein
MPDGQCGNTIATPDRLNRVDEIRKRAQLAGAASMARLIKCNYRQAGLP